MSISASQSVRQTSDSDREKYVDNINEYRSSFLFIFPRNGSTADDVKELLT